MKIRVCDEVRPMHKKPCTLFNDMIVLSLTAHNMTMY